MSDINLVTLLWKFKSNKIFKLCVINQHLRKMLWGFKSKYDFLLRNRTLISYMSSYEDTGTKSMFITRFGRQIIFQYSYEILYIIMKILSIITLLFSLHVAPKTH